MTQATTTTQVNEEVTRILSDLLSHSVDFQYSMLGRLKSDCEYFLGNGCRSVKHLWAGDVVVHVEVMKGIHNKLKAKPEWLSMDDILSYEAQMTTDRK